MDETMTRAGMLTANTAFWKAWWLAILVVLIATVLPSLQKTPDDRWPGAYGTV